ncbi:protein-export chaperone SecB [Microbulbifer thermotolerans]|uniref:Protein-export protein SecB n=1 Tax=Microbulbifer thermotolerans TaxID=252514 RepID=A0A143HQZ4_MICTH|nr:protein-export chaperone SecB [Microbulbifer thermotolerans]AMX03702.1 preprotein translocase subunit SecB [Microbulbifer thermotolerans]MCX2781068.1 protein-export chaperone SecB [Microbulbifer thermotolerans]MCX2783641.1 protein-export chaperone SecB [Microbulbifer thermotolerans]MCX2796238.1 protein-export chaperone SecB [Microbulbifer thermotolerans]MCX2803216.1 protein-export chaperone SecB [Microbulbifer thermotolerans]
MAEEHNGAAANSEAPKVQFAMQRIYLKDLSFETPLGPEVFKKQWKPQVNQELNTQTAKVDENLYEVALTLTITVKLEEETAFLVEVKQAGLFLISGLEGQQLAQALNTACPQILFPYAREVVDNVVTKGSFPALMLPPINFDALFAAAMAQAQKQAEGTKEEQAEA